MTAYARVGSKREELKLSKSRPYVPFHVKATRPRCDDEGCPDRSGGASHKESKVMEHHSEVFVALDTAKLRNAVAIADAGRNGEVRYLGEIDNSEAETGKLVTKLARKY